MGVYLFKRARTGWVGQTRLPFNMNFVAPLSAVRYANSKTKIFFSYFQKIWARDIKKM
jgi:hypothetical protein